MAADVRTSLKDWSTTVGSNLPTGSTSISTNLDDNLCQIQATVRYETASRDTIASATTCDLGTKDAGSLDITGTTTITSFGTVSAGIRKLVTFSGALTLTHNGTSLKLPGSANITTAAGDTALFESLGSGNWNCLFYHPKDGFPVTFPSSLTSGYYLTNNGSTLSWAVAAVSLSSMTAAGASNTLANANYQQKWGWTFTGSGQKGMWLNGKSNGSGQYGYILTIDSTDNGAGVEGLLRVSYADTGGPYHLLDLSHGYFAITGGNAASGTAQTCYLTGAHSSVNAAGVGGILAIQSGDGGASGTGGELNLKPGGGSTKGTLVLQNNTGSVALKLNNSTPSISSGGGAGASIRGCDNFFEVTCGTGSPANVVVGFSAAKSSAPMCVVSSSADAEMKYATTVNGVTITPASGTLSSGTKITCMVIEAT